MSRLKKVIKSLLPSNKSGPFILLYHRVTPDLSENNLKLKVSPEDFERQLIELKNKYQIVYVDELIGACESDCLGKVAVTFDDGYADNYHYAFPILKKYKVPVSIFLTTAFIGTHGDWQLNNVAELAFRKKYVKGDVNTLNQRYHFLKREEWMHLLKIKESDLEEASENHGLNWEQINEMNQSSYVRFECHGHWHDNLAHKTREEVVEDIQYSKELLKNKSGIDSKVFAYPFGGDWDMNSSVITVLKELGFKAGLKAMGRSNTMRTSNFELDRLTVVSEHSFK